MVLDSNNTDTPLTIPIATDTQLPQATETKELLFTSNITDSLFTNPISLLIRPGFLLPDNRYRFRLTVTNSIDRKRYSEIDIHTATHPSSGTLLASPSTGVSLETVFHIRAVKWTDNGEDFPLHYRIGFQVDNVTVWLTSRMEDDNIMTVLPHGITEGTYLTVIVQVSDTHNATTLYSKEIVVRQSSSTDLLDTFNRIREKVFDKGNLNEALSYLVATLFSIDLNKSVLSFHGMSATEFKTSVIELIIEMYYNDNLPPNVWLHEVLVWVLKLTTAGVAVPSTNVPQLLELIEEIIHHSSLLQTSRNRQEDILSIYANLLKSSSQIDVDNSRIVEDEITKSFISTYKVISSSLCQRTALFMPSQYVVDSELGAIKLYHSLFLSFYNLTCDSSSHESCPFNENEQSFVLVRESLLKNFASSNCHEFSSISKCSSYCVTSLQLLNDIRWNGSPYASIIKSYPISLDYISTDSTTEITDDSITQPISYYIPLKSPQSDTGQLKCVHWINGWSDTECVTQMEVLIDFLKDVCPTILNYYYYTFFRSRV